MRGGSLHVEEIEITFDFLDKIRSTVSHTANAFAGYPGLPRHDVRHFPEYRVGAFDRIFFAYRVNNPPVKLAIFDPFSFAFLYTPSAVAILAGDVIMISVSSGSLLSPAFGLQYVTNGADGSYVCEPGSGHWEPGLGWRLSRIPAALTIAQPMRRQGKKILAVQKSSALGPKGDGHIFRLVSGRWAKQSNVSFADLPVIEFDLAISLAHLEIYEWLIVLKELDNLRQPPNERVFMESMLNLEISKLKMISEIYNVTGGLRLPVSDRPPGRGFNMPSYW